MELDELIEFIGYFELISSAKAEDLIGESARLFHDQAAKFHNVIEALRELETCRQERDDYKRRLDVWNSGENSRCAEQYYKRIQELEQYKNWYEQLMDMTMQLDEHPEDYDGPCMCRLCVSYGADDIGESQ